MGTSVPRGPWPPNPAQARKQSPPVYVLQVSWGRRRAYKERVVPRQKAARTPHHTSSKTGPKPAHPAPSASLVASQAAKPANHPQSATNPRRTRGPLSHRIRDPHCHLRRYILELQPILLAQTTTGCAKQEKKAAAVKNYFRVCHSPDSSSDVVAVRKARVPSRTKRHRTHETGCSHRH